MFSRATKKSIVILSLLVALLLPAAVYAEPAQSTPQLTDGAAQTVTLRTGPGHHYPERFAVDAADLTFTARYGTWVQVGMLGWMEVEEVDPAVPDVSDLEILREFNGVIVAVVKPQE